MIPERKTVMDHLTLDKDLLENFEAGLDPQHPEVSAIPAQIIGYGEISTIFQINHDDRIAYKRMPLFTSVPAAERYQGQYHAYCEFLTDAGLRLPEHDTAIVAVPGRPVVLYIAQEKFPEATLAHRRIHTQFPEDTERMLATVLAHIAKVWTNNASSRPHRELALDGQLSNWIWSGSEGDPQLVYIDTSTPLFRLDGVEQLDPELLLKSAPGFLRWFIRLLFLKDVMNRYYDQRSVYIDLAGNLFKEQRPDLIPAVIDGANAHLPPEAKPISAKDVEAYYKEDKIIWSLFLFFRKIDRFLTTRIFRKRYEFILPGEIKR